MTPLPKIILGISRHPCLEGACLPDENTLVFRQQQRHRDYLPEMILGTL